MTAHIFDALQISVFDTFCNSDVISKPLERNIPVEPEAVLNDPAASRAGMAGLSTRERAVVDALAAAELAAITPADLVERLEMTRAAARLMLSRLCRKGWLQRVKRGVYVLVPLGSATAEPALADTWPLAMALFAPCYIAGWSAAEHWGLTEQIFNTIAVVTAKRQRRSQHLAGGTAFRTWHANAERLFGTERIWLGSQQVTVADPSRLIVDILDRPVMGGGGRHAVDVVRAYWGSEHADAELLLDYARRFGSGTVFKRLGFTAERFKVADARWLDKCRARITKGVSRLDPAGPDRGRIATRWNLRINTPVDEP